MVLDTQESLLDYIYDRLTKNEGLKEAMGGTVRLELTWAKPDTKFPYLVHRIDIRKEPGTHVIQAATYYLDIWSDSPSAFDEITPIRKILIGLLDELVFSTADVSLVHIEIMSDGFIPEMEQGIWHYATMWEWTFRRDAEAVAIEAR